MATRHLCLGKGKVDILFDRQSASLPAAIGQPNSHVTKYQPVRLWVGQMMAGGQGALPHWAPVQGPSTPTGSPWGMTYLTNARQVTQMSSTAHYIPLTLLLGTICSFVSTSPNHIFLHDMKRNVIQTIFPLDQFIHILPPSI